MSKLDKLLAGLFVVQAVIGVNLLLPAQTRTQQASASFDHSNCQYPDRWTNPADGCDNSDPAVPECIKAFSTEQGEKDCIAAFVAQHEKPDNTTAPTENIPLTPAQQCGGK